MAMLNNQMVCFSHFQEYVCHLPPTCDECVGTNWSLGQKDPGYLWNSVPAPSKAKLCVICLEMFQVLSNPGSIPEAFPHLPFHTVGAFRVTD